MRKKVQSTASTGDVQVFELTMDNPEDQDELNRRLRKPGEPDPYSTPKIGPSAHGESTAESTGKKKGRRKETSQFPCSPQSGQQIDQARRGILWPSRPSH